ncbi:MAG TPA: CRTAC1 family protein [Planctomycetaceae bacterium]|nr:CRTAC1 family protein [Planctomycetaceae bacterium]
MLAFAAGCFEARPPAPPPADTAPTPPPSSSFRLANRAEGLRPAFQYHNGDRPDRSAILELVGGGIALIDFDRDGRLDIFAPGGGDYAGERALAGRPAALFRSQGNWEYANCATTAGAAADEFWSHGAAAGDFDNDGFPDLLVTGYGGLQLLHNAGDGTFVSCAAVTGLDDRMWSTSAAFGDVDGDGNLDLYVTHYVDWSFDNDPLCVAPNGMYDRCSPLRYEALPDTLYVSGGDGTFTDRSQAAGLRTDGKGLGVVMADLDVDGDLDIYVANDTNANFLYRNDGHGVFEECAVAGGAAFNDLGNPDGSMGITVGDYDNDGLPDLLVSNYEQESIALYHNLGQCRFEHVSQALGVTDVGYLYVGFGVCFFDADCDGDEDVFMADGHVFRFDRNAPVRQLPVLLENQAGRRFRNVAGRAGPYLETPHIARGAARGDLDGDGLPDLVVSQIDEPLSVLQNQTERRHLSFAVRLIGSESNRDAIGARLTLETSSGRQYRQETSGESYLSQSDRTILWGVPAGTQMRALVVEWPNGVRQELTDVAAGQLRTLREPQR